MPAGVIWVAATPPSVPPCVQSLVGVDVLLKGVEARLEVLCCCAVAGVTEGVPRQGEWGVAPATSAVRRHSGSLFWRDKPSVKSSDSEAFREKDGDENLLQAAQVHPVLPVTVNPTGASAKNTNRKKTVEP